MCMLTAKSSTYIGSPFSLGDSTSFSGVFSKIPIFFSSSSHKRGVAQILLIFMGFLLLSPTFPVVLLSFLGTSPASLKFTTCETTVAIGFDAIMVSYCSFPRTINKNIGGNNNGYENRKFLSRSSDRGNRQKTGTPL